MSRHLLRAARTALLVGAVAATTLAVGGTAQASGKTSAGGDFAVTVNGTDLQPGRRQGRQGQNR